MRDNQASAAGNTCALTVLRAFRMVPRWCVIMLLLALHAGTIAYSSACHSPTFLEPALLASGVSHWTFGRFELYRVNPPLVRMVAAIPVIVAGCKTDWRRFDDAPGSRREFAIGNDFMRANGPRAARLMLYARWACIPFPLLGGYFVYRWAADLYGSASGLFSLVLWSCEPNLLAHAELITNDAACTSFGIASGYAFWRWLKSGRWSAAVLAGLLFGIALLAKMSWLVLVGLWPVLWLAWRATMPRDHYMLEPARRRVPSATQLGIIFVIATYTLNLGYGFDGTLCRLGDLDFVSASLNASVRPGRPGNRFRGTWLAGIRVPLPKQFVLGLDAQKKDFERYGQLSYLRGHWRDCGWWYYYLYGLLVKVPCGTLGIAIVVAIRRVWLRAPPATVRDELMLLSPAVAMLALVSSQTGFSEHLRYVFPAVGLAIIFFGQAVALSATNNRQFGYAPVRLRPALGRRVAAVSTAVTAVVFGAWSVASVARAYPHHLAYFNELAGGAECGWKHLLGSSFNWGQDLFFIRSHLFHSRGDGVRVFLVFDGATYDPKSIGVEVDDFPSLPPTSRLPRGDYVLPLSCVPDSRPLHLWGDGRLVQLSESQKRELLIRGTMRRMTPTLSVVRITHDS